MSDEMPIFNYFSRINQKCVSYTGEQKQYLIKYSKLFGEARHFIFTPSQNTEIVDTHTPRIEDTLDLPFETLTLSLSQKGQFLTVPQVIKNMAKDEVPVTHNLLVHESGPQDYTFFVGINHKGYNVILCIENVDDSKMHELYDFYFTITKHMLSRLYDKRMARGKVKTRIILEPKTKKKQGKRIRSYILVCPNEEREHYSTIGRGSVQWDHSWHVRGHWRRVATVGHDREGKPIPNFTWVKPHIKGEGPLKEKPYVVTA